MLASVFCVLWAKRRAVVVGSVAALVGFLLLSFYLVGAAWASPDAELDVSGSGPRTLPEECVGVNPPGLPVPSCCVYGYVYHEGQPVAGAEVWIESASGVVSATSQLGGESDRPYYSADLDREPLSVSAGDWITVSVTLSASTSSLMYQVAPNGQQLDLALARPDQDWWNEVYAYRRVVPITTEWGLAAGTLIKVDGFDLDSLVGEGKARADFNDLRVVRQVAAGQWQEVPRASYTARDLEFELVEALAVGADTSYHVYYGNPGAGAPPTLQQPQGWWVDMYHDKWWEEYAGTWAFDQVIDFDNVCDAPLNHYGKIGTRFDESDRFRGRLYVPTGGEWTFRVFTNDGYVVTINDLELGRFTDYDDQGRWLTTSAIRLTAGWHEMDVRNMWVNCGPFKLAMEGPSFPAQIVPANYLQRVDELVHRTTLQAEDALARFAPIATIHTIYPHPAVQTVDTVTLRGSAVDDDERGASITAYEWRSDVDGILATQAAVTLPASALSAGDHTISLRARDDEGTWSDVLSKGLRILTLQHTPPAAVFSVQPTTGYTTTLFAVDASGSSDKEDPPSLLEVRWDWEDDGAYDTAWSKTKTASHTYIQTGTHQIRLQVRDLDGMQDTTVRSATIDALPAQRAWLFILYLAGDNDLYRSFQRALIDLERMEPNESLDVVLLLDGPGKGDTWRYHVQPGGRYVDNITRWRMGELDMDDPQTLTDLIVWAQDNYPAKHTYLAVADHGRGTTGIAWDETSGSSAYLDVAELGRALRDATMAGAPLDVVHYDACLMAMIENAYQIKDYARYLIASENLGWSIFAYDHYAGHVGENTTPQQLAEAVVNEYDALLSRYPRTISALDLDQADVVQDAVSALATALQVNLDAISTEVQGSRAAAQKFDSVDYHRLTHKDAYLDLYDLAQMLKRNVPDAGVKSAAQGVMDAVESFVIAERRASGVYQDHPYWDLDDAHGVAIWFPYEPGDWDYENYMSHVYRFTAEGQWDEFLAAYLILLDLPWTEPENPGLPPVLDRDWKIWIPIVVR